MRYLRAALCVISLSFFFTLTSLPCEHDELIWIPRSATADPLYRFIEGNKVGYINQAGRVVIPPVISFTGGNSDGEFHDGLVEVGVSDGVYFNTSGKKAIKLRLYRGWDFSEGLAVAMKQDGGKWGYINTKGEFAISPRFASSQDDYVWPFEGGLAKIEVAGRFGYIQPTGEFVIQPQFLDGDSFHDGMARVIVEGPCAYSRIAKESPCPDFGVVPKGSKLAGEAPPCKYTFVDKTGQIISQRFDYALPFSEGLAPVRIGLSWGYINKTGNVIVAPRFESAEPFADDLALVSEHGLFGYIDRTGSYVIKPQFNSAEGFADGRAVIGDRGSGYRYIDRHGDQAIPETFALASKFFKGIAHVQLRSGLSGGETQNGTFEYIDISGKVVFKYPR